MTYPPDIDPGVMLEFDLELDPRELNNVYDDSAYTHVAQEMKAELKSLQEYYGDSEELAQKFLKEDMERRKK